MIRFEILCVSALALVGPAQAHAQEPSANRYTIERTDNGFVRLDIQTGEMSMCTEKSGQLVCRLSADERRAFEEALSDLSARVEALERGVDPVVPPEDGLGIPDKAELDRAIGAMEKMMRHFFGMVEDLRRDFESSPQMPPDPIPDRT